MRIKPNKTILQGKVLEISKDGNGSNITIQIIKSYTVDEFEDFICAQEGSILILFSPDITLNIGAEYTFKVSVIGGSIGQERIILHEISKLDGEEN